MYVYIYIHSHPGLDRISGIFKDIDYNEMDF